MNHSPVMVRALALGRRLAIGSPRSIPAVARNCNIHGLATSCLSERYCDVFPRRRLGSAPPAPTSDWPEHEYLAIANEMLESIFEAVLDAGEKNAFGEEFDAELSQGVLRIALGESGDYVINTQTPNRQIWLSSPTSGPWRFDWEAQRSEWVSTKGSQQLKTLLEQEFDIIARGALAVRIKPPEH